MVPRCWHRNRSVVGVGIEDLVRIAVPAMIRTLLPHGRAIGIWICDAEKRKTGDGKRELADKEDGHDSGISPAQLEPPWQLPLAPKHCYCCADRR